MPPVCNAPDLMLELGRSLSRFRVAAADGARRLDGLLENKVGRSWRDQRYEEYRERFAGELGVLLRLLEDMGPLEELAARLRLRLEEYLDDGRSGLSAGASKGRDESVVADAVREIVRRLLVRGTVEAIVRWFRAHPFAAEAFTELLQVICSAEVSRQLLLMFVLRELLFPPLLQRGDHPLPVSCGAVAAPALSTLLTSPDAVVRSSATALLGRIGVGDVGALSRLAVDQDPSVAAAAVSALGSLRDRPAAALASLRGVTSHTHPDVRAGVVEAAAGFLSAAADELLQHFASQPEVAIRERANTALIERDGMQRIEQKLAALHGTNTASGREADGTGTARAGSIARLLAAAVGEQLGGAMPLPQPVLAALSPGATLESFASARTALDQTLGGSSVRVPLPRRGAGNPRGFVPSLIASQLPDDIPVDSNLTARNPAVRAVASAVAAVRARRDNPRRSQALAHAALAAARETADRGLSATALALLADSQRRDGRVSDALETFAAAQEACSTMTVAERREWSDNPIALCIAAGRAAASAGTRGRAVSGIEADILAEILLLLLRMLWFGCSLASSIPGVLLRWAIEDLCAIYDPEERRALGA